MSRMNLFLSAAAVFMLWATSLSAQQIVNCSSDDGHRHYCQMDTHHRDVRLVKQRSDAACQEGSTWGHDRHGIWVDRGCRADFEIIDRHHGDNYGNNGYRGDDNNRPVAQAVNCSSDDGGRHYCAADTRGGVRLYKQRSDAVCQEGSTWGYDDHGIWVDRGCRADFQTGEGGR